MLKRVLMAGWMWCVLAIPVQGQFGGNGIITSADASKPGTISELSMTMVIEAKGADFKAAYEALKEKQKQATIRLEKLEAVEDSIEFSPIAASQGDQRQNMMSTMRRQMGNDPRVEKMMEMDPPVVLNSMVKARWKKSGTDEELLMFADELSRKIRENDVAGLKDEESELSEEQQELMEEMSEMTNYYDSSEKPAGTANLQYVASFSQADRQELMAQAFADAEKKASELATATKRELGDLTSVAASGADGDNSPEMEIYMGSYYGRQQASSTYTNPVGTIEVFSTNPADTKLTVQIRATFAIK